MENEIIKFDVRLPKADIDGLHFNEQVVHGVFERKDGGLYYSRDLLFISARDTDEGTGRDLLTEYLQSDAVKQAFQEAIGGLLGPIKSIEITIPTENQGVKRYNGVTCWYWLRDRYNGSAASFCYVNTNGGSASYTIASAAGGVAPAFCVA